MPSPPASTSATSRALGLGAATALVVGNMIGSGVFLLPASLVSFGGMALGGWLASGAGAIVLALLYARLARARPASGGPYAYTRLAFGDFAGFLVAWLYWVSVWTANAALALGAVGYLDPFIPRVVHAPAAAAAVAIVFVWALAAVNLWSVRSVGRLQILTTVIKILPLVLVGLGGLVFFHPARFAIVHPGLGPMSHDLSATAAITLFAFLGLESATIPADHVADADRTIARATVLGTLITGAICVAGTVGVMSLLAPDALAKSTAPFADAAALLSGDWARRAVAFCGAASCLGALNGWTLIAGELPRAAAEDGVFPAVFARTSARGTPGFGIVISAVLATILILCNSAGSLVAVFTFVILLSTLGTVVPYAFSALAGLLMAGPDGRPVCDTSGQVALALVGFAFSVWAIAGAGMDVVYWAFLLLLVGLPCFVWRKPRQPLRPGEGRL